MGDKSLRKLLREAHREAWYELGVLFRFRERIADVISNGGESSFARVAAEAHEEYMQRPVSVWQKVITFEPAFALANVRLAANSKTSPEIIFGDIVCSSQHAFLRSAWQTAIYTCNIGVTSMIVEKYPGAMRDLPTAQRIDAIAVALANRKTFFTGWLEKSLGGIVEGVMYGKLEIEAAMAESLISEVSIDLDQFEIKWTEKSPEQETTKLQTGNCGKVNSALRLPEKPDQLDL